MGQCLFLSWKDQSAASIHKKRNFKTDASGYLKQKCVVVLNLPPQPLAQPHRLKILWVHWVLANAASVGTYACAMAIITNYTADENEVHPVLNIASTLVVLGGIWVMGFAQQVILHSAGIQARFWGLLLYPGILVGCVLAMVGMFLVYILMRPFGSILNEFVAFVLVSGSFGIGIGSMQSIGTSWRVPQQCAWSLTSGLGMIAVGGMFILLESWLLSVNASRSAGHAALAYTLAGGVYGAVTGIALINLLPNEQQEVSTN